MVLTGLGFVQQVAAAGHWERWPNPFSCSSAINHSGCLSRWVVILAVAAS